MRYRILHKPAQSGFIALMSAVVISAILVGLISTVGVASFFARFDSLGLENKRAALALAESCVNVALLAIATSTDTMHYAASDRSVAIDADARGNPMTCVITDIIHSGPDVTIDAYASSDDSFDSVSAKASLTPGIQILSWNEQ